MLVSRRWLNEYVDISDIKTDDIARDLPLVGNEIEEITKISSATGLVIGKIVDCEFHPNSDHLHVCKVNVGKEILQIVCGAPNVRKDAYAIVAVDGAVLPNDITIKKTNLRGVESNGMLCSLQEIGIQEKYVPSEFKDGIYLIDGDDSIIGSDALEYLNYDDEVINFELTANRSDLYSIIGMSYEFAAIYNKEISLPDTNYKVCDDSVKNHINLSVQTKNCSIYITKMVKGVTIKESPKFIKSRLMASGVRPINNVVDISNYVMLEYGQPLHFFDSDKLGNDIIVRMAKDREEVVTLDGEVRILDDSDIVIANNKEAVALAGVMGGLSTEVTSDTKNITIEAAVFNPANIRNTSKNILRSEASIRYEKGVNAHATKEAMDRACHLLEKYADAEILDDYVIYSDIDDKEKTIEITKDKICNVLGMNIKTEEISDIFKKLGFKFSLDKNKYLVTVPFRRLDISIKEDLIEEIGRIHGYADMEGTLPHSILKQGGVSPFEEYKVNIRDYLTSINLNETVTYTLTNVEKSKMFTKDVKNCIQVADPLSEDKKITRYSLIPSLIEVCEYNRARNINDVNIFEISNVYYNDNNDIAQKSLCAGLLSGSYINNNISNIKINSDYYLVKGVVEGLLDYLKLNGRYEFVCDNLPKEMHPYMSASIYINKKYIGYIGCVHPNIIDNVYVFELDLDELFSLKIRNIKYKEISKYPSIIKDMAFVVDKDLESSKIMNVIRKNGTSILNDVQIFDVYTGENVLPGKKSIAFKLTFSNINRTLTDEEVMSVFNDIISKVENELGAELRDK